MKKNSASESIQEKPKYFELHLPNASTMGLALDTPIVIKSDNYIDAEVKVIQSFLSNYETVAWDVLSQHIDDISGRMIDCYEILVCDWNDSTKEGFNVKLYFDVTHCNILKD